MSAHTLRLACRPETYRRRRATLGRRLHRPLVIFAGHAPSRTYPANTYPFRAASTYLYFGGPPREHAALLIEPNSDGDTGCTLFRQPPDPDDAVWMGEAPTDADIAAAAGLSHARIANLSELESRLGSRPAGALVPNFPRTLAHACELKLHAADEAERQAVIDMRLCKDDEELVALRRAAEASIAAHRAALAATRPDVTENDVEAAFTAELIRRACQHSFSPIVTIHGEVLHGAAALNKLEPGRLLLVDAGAEEPTGYAGDITRTYPVTGQWSERQRQLYLVVLEAEQRAIAACVAGRRYREVHAVAARAICEGLKNMDILRGSVDELVERGAYTPFFTHGIGHLLGLDAHDMEDFGDQAGYAPGRSRAARFGDKYLRLDRDLAPGMVVTIEPGIYFVPDVWRRADLVGPCAGLINRPAVEAILAERFGGIRIEDDVVVRAAGAPEVLTAALPRQPDEVAALVGRAAG